MKPAYQILASAAFLAASAGCITSQGTVKNQLPADWIADLPKADSAFEDIAGVYVERGEELGDQFARSGNVTHANLSQVLSPKVPAGREARRLPMRTATTELRRIDEKHVELIARVDGEVTSREMLDLETEKDGRFHVLRHSKIGASAFATGRVAIMLRLWRATDGRLYVHLTGQFVGGITIVPTISSGEVWCRWDPATTEGLQKQAAAIDALATASRRATDLNRRRAKVATKAPPIYGADVVRERSIANSDYEGQVTVLYVWSTSSQPQLIKAVRELHEKYGKRGLYMVGVCKNLEHEREKVIEFAKTNQLPGPQLHDGKGARSELLEAYFGTVTAFCCVIDRRGMVASIQMSPKTLDAAVARVFGQP